MTTNISVAVKQREDFNLIKQRLEQLKVVDAATVEVAVESIVIAKRLYEFVENHRKSLTDPLKKQIDAINAEHKPILVWLEQARAQIELALKRYRLEEEEKARAEEEKRRAALEKEMARQRKALEQGKKLPTPKPLPQQTTTPPPSQIYSTTGKVVMRKRVRWRLVDESKLPREYLTVDEKKLNQLAAKSSPEALPVVPGVEFFIDEIISAH